MQRPHKPLYVLRLMKQVLRLLEELKVLPHPSPMPKLVFSFITSLVASNVGVTVIH